MALPYWGGKARIAKDIANAILEDADDAHDEYCEPFAGMASVARILATKKSWSRMSLNDKDERIAEYLDALCNSTWEPDVRAYPSISEWQRLKKAPPDVNTTFLGLFLGYAGHMFSGSHPQTPRVRRYNTVNDNFMAALETKRIAQHSKES
jgi:hypothetical protein